MIDNSNEQSRNEVSNQPTKERNTTQNSIEESATVVDQRFKTASNSISLSKVESETQIAQSQKDHAFQHMISRDTAGLHSQMVVSDNQAHAELNIVGKERVHILDGRASPDACGGTEHAVYNQDRVAKIAEKI